MSAEAKILVTLSHLRKQMQTLEEAVSEYATILDDKDRELQRALEVKNSAHAVAERRRQELDEIRKTLLRLESDPSEKLFICKRTVFYTWTGKVVDIQHKAEGSDESPDILVKVTSKKDPRQVLETPPFEDTVLMADFSPRDQQVLTIGSTVYCERGRGITLSGGLTQYSEVRLWDNPYLREEG